MKKRKNRSIFRMILSGMLIILCIEIFLILGVLYFSDVTDRLNRNACDLLDKQTSNRQTYVQNTLARNNNLSELSDRFDSALQELIDSGQMKLTDLDSDNDNCVPLLQAVSDDLIATLRQKSITGLFAAFSTKDLDSLENPASLSGIYMRDLDPDASPSFRNADLLLERSPIQLVQSMYISTDKNWKATIRCDQSDPGNFIYPAFETAFHDQASLEENDYGHMTTSTYKLNGDQRSAIAYTIPLILPDGTVYGVLGVEVLTSYLQSVMMPYQELENNKQGIYFLAYTENSLEDEEIPLNVLVSSSHTVSIENETLTLTSSPRGHWLNIDGTHYYASMQPLTVYNRNAPFSNEHWYLVGAVPTTELFSFSHELGYILGIAIVLTIVIGIFCCLFVSQQLARPISRMSNEVTEAQNNPDHVPVFSPTHIRELELFSSSISKLSQDIVNTSTKFLQIMDMASIEIGGYEVRHDTQSVYLTDNFFSLLGIDGPTPEELTPKQFLEIMKQFDESCMHTESPSGGKLYRIVLPNGNIRYTHIKETVLEHSQIGIAEDETAATLEKIRIEYERDYDSLTNLYNRRAFRRNYADLFRTPQRLKHAALIMLDLDNLKFINDTFGHDYGDKYIQLTGQCISRSLPSTALYAHISGDEFIIFLYGYDSKSEISDVITKFRYEVRQSRIELPDGTSRGLSISGGISWYPDNTTDPASLKKYADFAMYQVKRNNRGSIKSFEPGIYQQELYVENTRKEFHQLIRDEKINYYFQPIISAKTGVTCAFEALMRVSMPILKNPAQVLQIAKEEDCLHEIERITVFKSSEAFLALKKSGAIRGDELLFVNSISSQYLTEEEGHAYTSLYSELQKQLVVEVTEGEDLIPEILERKRTFPGFSGIFALDDYGSGYSNEKTLLSLSPHYIKLDISLIHNIDTDLSKQQLASYIISYAHLHNIQIIAEGLETPQELKKVLELGADLLQGYYLARPAAVPGPVSPEALKIIRESAS